MSFLAKTIEQRAFMRPRGAMMWLHSLSVVNIPVVSATIFVTKGTELLQNVEKVHHEIRSQSAVTPYI